MAEITTHRQVILDTETTGISTAEGHRIIEIGCVEMINRKLTGNTFHQYINPQREVEAGAMEVHGITNEFLQDKPLFIDITEDFLQFIIGAELIIHNAPFDVGFIDHELGLLKDERRVNTMCTVLDTLKMARDKHPGQKNNLDALCKRYDVDNSNRELHGALLDAEILGDVYLAMTGGQVSMLLAAEETAAPQENIDDSELTTQLQKHKLKVLKADESELAEHQAMLEKIQQDTGGNCVWLADS